MAAITFPGGGTGVIVQTDGAAVVLQASVSSPPGSFLPFLLAPDATSYRVKVRGCRKTDEGGPHPFRIDGRFVDLTRAERDAVVRALSRP